MLKPVLALCGIIACAIGFAVIEKVGAQVPPTLSTILIDGKPITATTLNLISGPSILWVCSPIGTTQLNCQSQANTASLVTKTNLQAGSATRCVSVNGTFAYTCGTCLVNGQLQQCNGGLNPSVAIVTPGMEIEFIPDVPCAADQPCTLNVDNTGLFTIKANDGGNNGAAISGNGHTIHRLGADQISGQVVWRMIY